MPPANLLVTNRNRGAFAQMPARRFRLIRRSSPSRPSFLAYRKVRSTQPVLEAIGDIVHSDSVPTGIWKVACVAALISLPASEQNGCWSENRQGASTHDFQNAKKFLRARRL